LEELHENCFFEKDPKLCEKEVQDRKDLAEVLRMQSELRLRMEYLRGANLFVDDVSEERAVHERDDFVDNIMSDLDV
jgi:hypothetical protein